MQLPPLGLPNHPTNSTVHTLPAGLENCFQKLGSIGIICRSLDQSNTFIQVWGIRPDSEGYFLLQTTQEQVDARGSQGLVSSSPDGRVAVRLVGPECVKRDEHGNSPRVFSSKCVAWQLTRPDGIPMDREQYIVVSMGPNIEGKVHSAVFDNSLSGHVIGTVDTFTGLPGIINSPEAELQPAAASAAAEPGKGSLRIAPAVQIQPERADGSIVHIVQPGDTTYTIAKAYQVSLMSLVERNGLSNKGRKILAGQELIIRSRLSQGPQSQAVSQRPKLSCINCTWESKASASRVSQSRS